MPAGVKTLLITPPMTQLNTPYPATAYLTGFLRDRGFVVTQEDAAIDLIARIFSRAGLEAILLELQKRAVPLQKQRSVNFFKKHFQHYAAAIDATLGFLQGRDASLAHRIVTREFLPEGPRFESVRQLELALGPIRAGEDPLTPAFGALGLHDRAKFLASLFIDDIADCIREGIDPDFELARYGERLASSSPTFDPMRERLEGSKTIIDTWLEEITAAYIGKHAPTFVGLTVPFPGNLYGALRMARHIKSLHPEVKIALGGGYVNTELRELTEPRIFDYVDFICVDDGEAPMLALLNALANPDKPQPLLRTFKRSGKVVVWSDDKTLHDIPQKDTGLPTYDGLQLNKYVSLLEMLNPMHRIWSDGRWNKLTLAHGCYWKNCHFCDTTLDYISRYDPAPTDMLMRRIHALIEETGTRGFHFVDEAAPPQVLFALADRLIREQVAITWWGNIRFEKTFNNSTTALMAKSGCIAVSGGLEVASDRLLKLMNKGVTVEQVARVTHAFSEAGILVHAYLMYGFPTQTTQETVDALERVRQLFAAGCIQSAYWHRFAATVHSPIGKNPEKFGINAYPDTHAPFARNDLAFTDPTPCDHESLGVGLRKALYNFMHGIGLEEDVRAWFDFNVPKAKVPRRLVTDAIAQKSKKKQA